jgi:hypothetical protein
MKSGDYYELCRRCEEATDLRKEIAEASRSLEHLEECNGFAVYSAQETGTKRWLDIDLTPELRDQLRKILLWHVGKLQAAYDEL